MAGFDDLIRGALEKQGNPDAERRNAIYASSRQALERMLAQNTSLDAAAAAVQRDRLELSIATIEQDYSAREASEGAATPIEPTLIEPSPVEPPRVAPEPVVTNTPPVQAGAASSAPPQPRMANDDVEPPVASVAAPSPVKPQPSGARVEPTMETGPGAYNSRSDQEAATLEDFTGEYRKDPDKERRPYAKLLLWTIILVGLGVAVWWAITFGPELLRQKIDGRIPNSQQPLQSGTFVPGAEDGWRKVFVPSENAENIDAAGRGTADIFVEGETSFVRIASAAGATRNTIRIKLPRGILFAIRGKAATFEFIMKGRNTEPQQFAVFCEFGAMGECGRKRFKITDKAEAFIFDVLVNDVVLSAGNDAYLAINTDLSSSGKEVDLYSIRVRPGE